MNGCLWRQGRHSCGDQVQHRMNYPLCEKHLQQLRDIEWEHGKVLAP